MHKIGFHRTARRRAGFARQKIQKASSLRTGTFDHCEMGGISDRERRRGYRGRAPAPVIRERGTRVLRLPRPAHINRSNRSRETRQMGQVSGGSFRAQR